VVRIHAGEPLFRFNNLEVECCVLVQILYRSLLSAFDNFNSQKLGFLG
jgi:hypothetical protein